MATVTHGKPCCDKGSSYQVTGADYVTTGPKVELSQQMIQQLQSGLPARSNDGLGLGGK